MGDGAGVGSCTVGSGSVAQKDERLKEIHERFIYLYRHIRIDIMVKGLLKLWMLRAISEGEVSGYQIMKRVDKLTGKKPSTGSVYPLLKSMQNEGWIIGKKTDNKTIYHITDSGREVVDKHDKMKDYYSEKIHESICLAHETFDNLHFAFSNNRNLLSPLIQEVSMLLSNGIEPDEINKIISNARKELKKLKKLGK